MKSEAWIKGRLEYEIRSKEFWQEASDQTSHILSKNTYLKLVATHEACEQLLKQILDDAD